MLAIQWADQKGLWLRNKYQMSPLALTEIHHRGSAQVPAVHTGSRKTASSLEMAK